MASTIVLAGGGTAGHVNPLLATAAELVARGHRAVAVGSPGGIEEDLVPRAGIDLRLVSRVPAPRRPNRASLGFPAAFRRAIAQAQAILEEERADAVVGFGGYVSTPIYLAARRLRLPIVVHEANARPGLANRLGARYAARVAVTVEGTPLRGAVVTGLPLRAEVSELAAALRDNVSAAPLRERARTKLGWPVDAVGALVMGGSLGAASINAAVAECIEALTGHGLYVVHLTGRGKDLEAERARGDLPAKSRSQYVVREYQHDMTEVFAAVDAVVCRSGAATVAEVSALGIPAVYVPLPIGNGEQALNAAPSVAAGAAVAVANEDLTGAVLLRQLERLLLEPGVGRTMRAAARDAGIVDGAARLADLIEEALA